MDQRRFNTGDDDDEDDEDEAAMAAVRAKRTASHQQAHRQHSRSPPDADSPLPARPRRSAALPTLDAERQDDRDQDQRRAATVRMRDPDPSAGADGRSRLQDGAAGSGRKFDADRDLAESADPYAAPQATAGSTRHARW